MKFQIKNDFNGPIKNYQARFLHSLVLDMKNELTPFRKFQGKLHQIIFGSDTFSGKMFDLMVMISILLSVFAVMLDSVKSIHLEYGNLLYIIEWFFTILFTIEYILRLISIRKPILYALSFFGIVDLLAVIPTYLSVIIAGSQYLLVIRILRVLRIFRVLKFVQYIGEAQVLARALLASRRKITLFLFTVLTVVVIIGSLMYVVEGEKNGFTNIPTSIYWSIVTLTTVGYGDISPQTSLGQALAAVIMIIGYSIIAVPTGIVTAEMSLAVKSKFNSNVCQSCSKEGHDTDAEFCKHCGTKLYE